MLVVHHLLFTQVILRGAGAVGAVVRSRSQTCAGADAVKLPASGTANRSTGTATRLGSDTSRNVTVPYMAMLMRSQGKSDTSISTALRQDGYSSAEIAQILQQMRR